MFVVGKPQVSRVGIGHPPFIKRSLTGRAERENITVLTHIVTHEPLTPTYARTQRPFHQYLILTLLPGHSILPSWQTEPIPTLPTPAVHLSLLALYNEPPMAPDLNSLPPSRSISNAPAMHRSISNSGDPTALRGQSPSPSPRSASTSLQAAAAVNAGLQHEDSRRTSNTISSQYPVVR